MKDAIINILIVNPLKDEANLFVSFLKKPGYNILVSQTTEQAEVIFSKIEIGIILISNKIEKIDWEKFVQLVGNKNSYTECFIIVTGDNLNHADELFEIGITDFIEKPFSKTQISAKINNFKRLYFKNRKIVNLLENILPNTVLAEFKQHNKYTPKKHKQCVILFTDFIEFSKKAYILKPQELLKLLDHYFSEFDSIFEKYNIEKIKTIGDSYMAVAGLDEENPANNIKMALAALEIRSFIEKDHIDRQAKNLDYWDIRIGIHTGDLIAGVIGRKKFTFDVWGDSVNTAARCEQHALPNQINISEVYKNKIEPYFMFTDRGLVEIKHGEKIKMFLLNQINSEFCIEGNNLVANKGFREIAKLPKLDFLGIRNYVLTTLAEKLDEKLLYHSITHTINVEKAALKYAKLEGISAKETILLRTAAIFHDIGFLNEYQQNEAHAVELLCKIAPQYGYSSDDIKFIEKLILATASSVQPQNIFEKIICDADHDYLGKKDYHLTAKHLRHELQDYGQSLTEEQWLNRQIDYLQSKHQYYTNSALNIRQAGKEKRIEELKKMLASLHLKK